MVVVRKEIWIGREGVYLAIDSPRLFTRLFPRTFRVCETKTENVADRLRLQSRSNGLICSLVALPARTRVDFITRAAVVDGCVRRERVSISRDSAATVAFGENGQRATGPRERTERPAPSTVRRKKKKRKTKKCDCHTNPRAVGRGFSIPWDRSTTAINKMFGMITAVVCLRAA